MPLKKATYKQIDPDPKYQSTLLARFVNYVMHGGKKTKARKIVYEALDKAKKELKEKPLDIFNQAIDNASPLLEVRSKRIGGANYQIPREVNGRRQKILAMRWMVEGARSKSGSSFANRLGNELIKAYRDEGYAVEKKEESHRMAEANKAFAHYAKF